MTCQYACMCWWKMTRSYACVCRYKIWRKFLRRNVASKTYDFVPMHLYWCVCRYVRMNTAGYMCVCVVCPYEVCMYMYTCGQRCCGLCVCVCVCV